MRNSAEWQPGASRGRGAHCSTPCTGARSIRRSFWRSLGSLFILLLLGSVACGDDSRRGSSAGEVSTSGKGRKPAEVALSSPNAANAPTLASNPGVLFSRAPELDGGFDEIAIRLGSLEGFRHLSGGWSYIEQWGDQHWMWSSGRMSGIRFRLDRARPLQVTMHALPFQHPEGRTQRVHVWINGAYLRTFAIQESASHYRIALPQASLRRGWNRVELRYAWTAVPAELNANSKDNRELAVAFREFRIEGQQDNPSTPKPTAVASTRASAEQPVLVAKAPGRTSYLLWPPEAARLDVGWSVEHSEDRLASPVHLRITAQRDHREQVLLEEETRDANRRVDRPGIPVPEGEGALRLVFEVTKMPAGATVRWLDPRVTSRGSMSSAPEPPRVPPATNVVVIVLDAARRDHLETYGGLENVTPHIDEFARESLVFDAAFAQASYTLASTGSLFTGQLPATHGFIEERDRLDPNLTTLAEVFSQRGYATGLFSANPYVSETFGTAQGFDHRAELFRGLPRGDVVRAAQFHDPFLDWAQRHRGEPFFAYIHYVQPHEPYNVAPERFYRGLDLEYDGPIHGGQEQMRAVFKGTLYPTERDARRIRRLYEGNYRYVDHEVGRLLEKLRDLGVLERSVVVVTSDHGESLGEEGEYGHGRTVQEELLRIPLIMRLPSSVGRSGRVGEPTGSMDLMPTLLETLGLPVPDAVEGRNVLDPGTSNWPRPVLSIARGRSGTVSVVVGDLRYTHDPSSGQEQLLPWREDDPRENLRFERPVSFEYLLAEAVRLNSQGGVLASSGQTHETLPEETRDALRALGYVE